MRSVGRFWEMFLCVGLVLGVFGEHCSSLHDEFTGQPIKVLILAGQSNHDWSVTTPFLRTILEDSGLMDVAILNTPWNLSPEHLQGVDVILSNWNNFGVPSTGVAADFEWTESARHHYVEFVRMGGGHVAVHAGSSSFPDWADYRKMGLASWETGITGHGPVHLFPVRIENPLHPAVQGVQAFEIIDELWHSPAVIPGAEILASAFSSSKHGGSGQWEPTVLVGHFDKGRCFTMLLGHGSGAAGESMESPHFATLLIQGVQWTGRAR